MTLTLPAYDFWQDQALCAQVDPEIFFPEKGGSARPAKGICASCPVKTECLNHAITHEELFGVWGGLSQHERLLMRRRPTTLRPECGTVSGYWRHSKARESACPPCLDAIRDDTRRRRAGGTA